VTGLTKHQYGPTVIDRLISLTQHSVGSRGARRTAAPTPVGAIARGLVAGAAGTAAMDALLYARYRRQGGANGAKAWELSDGLSTWANAPAPAQVGKRLIEGLFEVTIPPTRAKLLNNLVHWTFGMLSGASYGVVAGSSPRPRISDGIPFGSVVWVSGYVVLPAAKLYQPIWKYDARTLANDLSAHVMYGLATATALQLLSG
jgi:hypothetical protein